MPKVNDEAERESRQAVLYDPRDGDLYRHCPNGVALRCISKKQGRKLHAEIHDGNCGDHSSLRMLVGKVFRSGFYWPNNFEDATELVNSHVAFQFHTKQIHQPAQGLQTIPLSWPFAVLGLDILGPFPHATGVYCYLYVTVDKFTKWAEVELVRTIPAGSTIKFIKCLVCYFEVPNRIIMDYMT